MLRTRVRGSAALLLVALSLAVADAQPTPDQQAEALLNAGRKGYNEGNPQFAAERFTELLTKFGGSKHAQDARYGLGLALLDLPDRNYQKALEAFTPPAGDAKFSEQASALYHAGVCQRGLGQKELAEGVAKPNEMPQRQNNANGKFTEAAKLFTAARDAFEKKTPPDAGVGRPRSVRHRRDGTAGRQDEGGPRHRRAVREGRGPRQEQVPPARPVLPRHRQLPAERHPVGGEVARPARAVRPAVRPARALSGGPRPRVAGGERRGRRPRSTRSSRSTTKQKTRGGRGAEATAEVRERPVGEGAARSAREEPGAGLRRGQRVLRRVPQLRGRQVRRGAGQVRGVRQGLRRVAAEGRRDAPRSASARCSRSSSTRR